MMDKSAKAALLSAVVFPGAGHFFLKKPVVGTLLAGIAAVALYLLVSRTVERALEISEKIQTGEVPLDVLAISQLVTEQGAGNGAQGLGFASTLFVVCWLIGIFDAYRVGRRSGVGKV